jgi:hypothetical protein
MVQSFDMRRNGTSVAIPMPMAPSIIVATPIGMPITAVGGPTAGAIIISLWVIIRTRLDNIRGHCESSKDEPNNANFLEHLRLLYYFDVIIIDLA